MKLALIIVALALLGGMAWVRLAPFDPARWHRLPATDTFATDGVPVPGNHATVSTVPRGARAWWTTSAATPEELLAHLDRVALATARTRRVAGSPAEGMVTWVTRSAVFGFPDYTTATAQLTGDGVTLRAYARQRFGRRDFGVNAARLRDWFAQLGAS